MFLKTKVLQKGSAMVEIIVGASIMLVGILAIDVSYNTYMQYALANQRNIEANYLLNEGIETLTFFRDKSWVNISGLSTTTTYYLDWSGGTWATTTSFEYIDNTFVRSVSISDVFRNANDDIADSAPGNTYDPNTKLVTATVSYWQGHGTTTKTLSKYIANIR